MAGTETLDRPDGVQLAVRTWGPDRPAAVVAGITGYGEHAGRYAWLGERLASKGIRLSMHDHRGFGRSGGAPGLISSLETLADDARSAVEQARSGAPEAPWALFGHSMGGALATYLMGAHGLVPRVGVISSPALLLPDPWPLQRLAGLLGAVWPSLPTVPLKRRYISRLPDVVERAMSDPDNYHGRVRAATGAVIIRLAREAARAAARIEVPLFIVQGEADRIVRPEGAELLAERVSGPATVHRVPDGAHETFNDLGGEDVRMRIAAAISAGVEAHLSGDRPV